MKNTKKILTILLLITMAFISAREWYEYHQELYTLTGSARASLLTQMTEMHGDSYTQKIISVDAYSDSDITVYEDKTYSFKVVKVKKWDDSMPDKDSEGVDFSKNCKMRIISCKVTYSRYGIDANQNEVFHSEKVVTYLGYEDTDLNSAARTNILPETEQITYDDSEQIFEK